MQRLDALSRDETYYSKKNGKFHFFYKRWGKPLPFVPSQEGKLITPSGREISLFYRTLGRLAFEDQTVELGKGGWKLRNWGKITIFRTNLLS
jgi:hypothetical protein